MIVANPRLQTPRKTPRQARSLFTVDILLDATIQVLLAEGPQRLTTTRVAERAGVSIGTVYQYYDNRLSLLYATHRRHVCRVSEAMVQACRDYEAKELSTMVRGVVMAFVGVKTVAADEARALYLVTPELTAAELVTPEALEVRNATAEMLGTATDARFVDLPSAAWMFMSAMIGPIRSALERGITPDALQAIGEQTVTLCDSYLHTLAVKH